MLTVAVAKPQVVGFRAVKRRVRPAPPQPTPDEFLDAVLNAHKACQSVNDEACAEALRVVDLMLVQRVLIK